MFNVRVILLQISNKLIDICDKIISGIWMTSNIAFMIKLIIFMHYAYHWNFTKQILVDNHYFNFGVKIEINVYHNLIVAFNQNI